MKTWKYMSESIWKHDLFIWQHWTRIFKCYAFQVAQNAKLWKSLRVFQTHVRTRLHFIFIYVFSNLFALKNVANRKKRVHNWHFGCSEHSTLLPASLSPSSFGNGAVNQTPEPLLSQKRSDLPAKKTVLSV